MQNDDNENEGIETVSGDIDQSAAFRLVAEIVSAVDDLPIIERLEMARNMVQSNGGERDGIGSSFPLIVVCEVLGDVIRVLRKNPTAANLRTTDPDLG